MIKTAKMALVMRTTHANGTESPPALSGTGQLDLFKYNLNWECYAY